MKFIYILHVVLLMNYYSTLGQTNIKNLPKKITISGYVPDSCIKSITEGVGIEIFFHDDFDSQRWHEGKVYSAKIVKNKFSITIQPKDDISYFQIRTGLNSLPLLRTFEMDEIIINAGDRININFKSPDSADFTGFGAEKMNYLTFAGRLTHSWGNTPYTPIGKVDDIDFFKNLANEHLKLTLDSLDKIKNKLSEKTYQVLRLNTVSAINFYYTNRLTGYLTYSNSHLKSADSLFLIAIKNELSCINLLQNGYACYDVNILTNAGSYIKYLSDFQLTYNQVFSNDVFPPYIKTFRKITDDYSGVLRDKILVNSINRSLVTYGSADFVSKALIVVKDLQSKQFLQKIYNSKTLGVPAYDFSFEDVNGKQLTLKSLRGKVVVLEAWFNGCTGCVGLAKRMHPIIERYKYNKNIVFISLNVDRDKKKFIDGVKEGKYGSRNSLFVYTNGKGWEHPMCLQYQWLSYPNMIIIDKYGKILSANTIDPKNETSKLKLIKLIEDNI